MKILITGGKGALGKAAAAEALRRSCEYIAPDRDEMDVTDEKAVSEIIEGYSPDCVIHCAAYTDVEGAEKNREECMAVNCRGTENVAKACEKIGAKMIYVSTDFVFDGRAEKPIEPYDEPHPINLYGESKLAGERAAKENCSRLFIVRTSRLYGEGSRNFIPTMLRLLRQGKTIYAAYDRLGSPTYCKDLAVLLLDMAYSVKYGIYHGVNEGWCSLYELANEIKRLCGYSCAIDFAKGEAFENGVPRPARCVLSTKSSDGIFKRLPMWQDALMRYLEDIGELE